MASLTHVCMWSDNGWKRITAEEAAKLHPGGTVSARSGLFMCELCGQYVTLTDGDIRTRYFKHSAYEKSKNCPERTFGAGYLVSYSPQEHELPIRITDVSVSSFRFEVGLIRATISTLSTNFYVVISPVGDPSVSYKYNKERLNCDGITFLSIGERPFEKYTLEFQNGSEELRKFWPKEINGIDPDGTLFDTTSGKKLTYDADVEIGKEYYLLKRGGIYIQRRLGMKIQEILRKRFAWDTWVLYRVSASEFSEDAARFYLDFHCRLTEHPVSLQPIWPLFVESNFMIKHNYSSMYMLVEGNAETFRTFPPVKYQLEHRFPDAKLYEISCSGRQQLISAGRTQALQYTYFWKEPLDQEGIPPEVLVTDIEGGEITQGEINTLPQNKTMIFKSNFDGELIILIDNVIVDKRKLLGGKYIEQDGLAYGLTIRVVIGLDIIWQVEFIRQQSANINDEIDLLKYITNVSGELIPVPHAMRNILVGMDRYPRICQWIRKCIKIGTVNEQSYRRLQTFYRSLLLNR